MNEAERPTGIELVRDSSLRIRWADGHESELPLLLLRQRCPCATCRHEREQAGSAGSALRVLPSAAAVDRGRMTTAESAELVGHYALRIRWRDGHDLGIFDYAMLRRLCPCPACGSLADRP